MQLFAMRKGAPSTVACSYTLIPQIAPAGVTLARPDYMINIDFIGFNYDGKPYYRDIAVSIPNVGYDRTEDIRFFDNGVSFVQKGNVPSGSYWTTFTYFYGSQTLFVKEHLTSHGLNVVSVARQFCPITRAFNVKGP